MCMLGHYLISHKVGSQWKLPHSQPPHGNKPSWEYSTSIGYIVELTFMY